MQSLEDPLHRVHSFDFEPDGRLKKDKDPAGGYKQLDRSETATGHRVTITTAMGRVQSHEVATLASGDRQRTHTGWDGLATVVQSGKSGAQTVTTPDGMTITSEIQGDPRFGLQAPLVGKEITTPPLGRTRQVLLHTMTQGDRSWVYTCEDNGWLTTITDPLLNTSTFHHDPVGRVREAIRPDHEVIDAS